MINFIDNITDFVLKAFFEIHRIFLIGILLLVFMFGEFEINNIYYCSLIIILLSYILSNIILKKSNKESKMNILLLILGIIINAIMLTFLFYYHSIDLKIFIFIFIYFLLIWLKGIHIVIANDDLETYISKFIISIIIIMFIGLILSLNYFDWIKTNLLNYLLSYFFISLILIARINLYSAYSGNIKNTINKKKNILIFSVLTNFIIVITSLFSFQFKVYLENIFKYILKLLYDLLYSVAIILDNKFHSIVKRLMNKFFEILYAILNKFAKKDFETETFEIFEVDNTYTYNPFIENTIIILKWVIPFLIIVFLLYNIYKITKKTLKNKINDDGEDEIKNFVLTKEDILNNLKNPFNKLSKNISKLFNKDKSLHIIRQIYIDIIIILNKKGYELKKSFTPNEYIETIEETTYKKELISLTKYYNIIRYSNKKITNEEIANAIKIKNEIKEVNRS